MNFQELLAGINLDASLTKALEDLLLAKSQSKEIGKAARVDIIDEFIVSEFDWARAFVKSLKPQKAHLWQEADRLFRDIIR